MSAGRQKTYHIIGGGIAGLYAAREIKEEHPKSKVIVYEAAAQCGGRCRSFYDKELQTQIDAATHVVLGANSNTLEILKDVKLEKVRFWDIDANSEARHQKFKDSLEEIVLAIFNTKPQDVSRSMLFKTLWKLFPFTGKKIKAYFSKNDLSETLIEPLLKFVDEVKYGYCLKDFEKEGAFITKLIFNQEDIYLDRKDKVISAVDAHNYHKIFGGEEFEFESIINIFYRTSMKITLPEEASFWGMKNALSQWIFANKDTISVTISKASEITLSHDELAREVWQEICKMRDRKALIMPSYRVIENKRATIKQDKKNNDKRPTSTKISFKNLYVIGDWTVKNFPCCIEGAILSAKRICSG